MRFLFDGANLREKAAPLTGGGPKMNTPMSKSMANGTRSTRVSPPAAIELLYRCFLYGGCADHCAIFGWRCNRATDCFGQLLRNTVRL